MKSLILILGLITASQSYGSQVSNKILVVLSSENKVALRGGTTHPTGYFLSELIVPVAAFMKAGFEPVFATPNGKEPTMDIVSDSKRWFKDEDDYKRAKSLIGSFRQLKKPLELKAISEKQLVEYSAIFLPGGHAPMNDLVKDQELGRILRHFHENQKPTALICHAPVALLSAKNQDWPYKGYRMTVFSNAEEQQEETAGHLGGQLTYYVADALSSAGANVSVAQPWSGNVVVDRELITGQNPMSDSAISNALLEALSIKKFDSTPLDAWATSKKKSNTGYIVLGNNLDLKVGYTSFFIGTKKKQVYNKMFYEKIRKHISQVKGSFEPFGLKGYLVYIGYDYEIAYLNWPNKEVADKAFASESGKAIVTDAQTFLENVVFKDVGEVVPKVGK